MSRVRISLTLFALGLVNTIPAVAQDDLAAELYGQGVHAYHAKQPKEAFELLNSSIEQSKKDPRAYFFRGLAQHSLGRPDEATADFKTAAELEVMGSDRKYNISFALERVQGSVRLEIERLRRTARLELRAKKLQIDKIKYKQFQDAESDALLDKTRKPVVPNLPAVAADDPNDPFSGAETADDVVVTAPADPVKPADPFSDPADKPADTTKPNDPFAIPADKPADTTKPNDPSAIPGGEPADPGDPFALPTNDPPRTPGAGAPAGGALSGIFRAFGRLIPSPPSFGGEAEMEFSEDFPDELKGLPLEDPFAPKVDPSDTKKSADPFEGLK
ncbi:MAG: hypothetical protein ABGX22_16090 [Pirellulaceae bacterium]|nr:hypothetical protein [Planctomycetaceae bacterium]